MGGGGGARMAPGGPRPAVLPATPAMPSAARPGAAATPSMAASISGPGLDTIATAAAPAAERHQRDLEAAQRAGTPTAGGATKPATVVKTERRLGRNDPCPQDSGRKYKKCCNRPDGTCTGEGLTRAPSPDDGTEG